MSVERASTAAVTIGYAADAAGHGVAYATLVRGERLERLRVPFAVHPLPALLGRDVGYAAVGAVADELVRRGERRVAFRLSDERLVDDLAERRALPAALTIPYVTLKCRLNRLHAGLLVAAQDADCRDLEARARAEISLAVAA